MAALSVIVPMKDARRFLDVCLTSAVRSARVIGAEVIVVDNGSRDGSPDLVRARFPEEVRLLDCSEGGISKARNMAALSASGDVLVFIDSDCEVQESFLLDVRELFANPLISAAGCKYALPKGAKWLERSWHDIHFIGRDGPVKYLPGGNLSVRRVAFDAVGGFDESLVTGEDAELCSRLVQAGHSVMQFRRLVSVHHGNAKTLSGFFRKQRWHALGMATTARRGELDLPFIASMGYAACVLAALMSMFLLPASPSRLLSWAAWCSVAVAAIPFLTVMWRARSVEKLSASSFLGALVLYHIYFIARVTALIQHRLNSRNAVARRG